MAPTRLLGLLLLTAAGFGPAGQVDDSAPSYELRLTSPAAGEVLEYYSWAMGLGVEVRAPRGDYEVELRYAGIVHHLLALEGDGVVLDDGRRRWGLHDGFIEFQDGAEQIELRLLSLSDAGVGSGGRLLAETKVELRYRSWSKQKLDEQVTERAARIASGGLGVAWYHDPREAWRMIAPDDDLETQRRKALDRIQARHGWLVTRVDVLTQLGEVYAFAGRPGDALVMFRKAEELYEREAGQVLHERPLAPQSIRWNPGGITFAPWHLRRLAEFYGRRMELERAAHYMQLQIDFYNDQRKNHPGLDEDDRSTCWEQSSYKMRELARLHYALRRDRAAYDLWTQKAKEAWAKARPSEGGLLGQ